MKPWYALCSFAARCILRLLAPVTVHGTGNIPRDRNFILASNHFSFFEPPLLGGFTPVELHFFAKKKLFEIPVLGPLITSLNAVPINRGSTDLTGLNAAADVLLRGGNLLIFPEGGRNKTGRLKDAKGGIGYLVMASKVPVIPVYIRNSNQMLKCLRRQARISIAFGPPLEPDPQFFQLERKEAHRRIGAAVMDRIAALERETLAIAGKQ